MSNVWTYYAGACYNGSRWSICLLFSEFSGNVLKEFLGRISFVRWDQAVVGVDLILNDCYLMIEYVWCGFI